MSVYELAQFISAPSPFRLAVGDNTKYRNAVERAIAEGKKDR
jgi:hypothetical protein